MPLTDKQIRNASATTRRVLKLSDGEGPQLWVKPSGAKLWNLAYRFDGKQRKLAIGPYPRISLKDARTRRDGAKRLLDDGLDPSQQKRLAKLAATAQNANTFATIADELLAQKRREGQGAGDPNQAGMAVRPRQARPWSAANRRNRGARGLASAARRRGARPAGNCPPLTLRHRFGVPLRGCNRASVE